MTTDNGKKLISQIEARKNLGIENDPRFVEGEKRVEQFKVKLKKAETCVEERKNDILQKEEEIGRQVLTGGSAVVGQLSQHRQKLSEAEDEVNIMARVIQQAENAVADLKAKIRKEFSLTNATLLAGAVDDISLALEPIVEKIQALREACGLPYLSGSNWSVFREGILGNLSELEKAVRELRTERDKQRQTIRDIEREPWGD